MSETVLVYLAAEEVRAALTLIAGNFPGARLAFDTTNRRAVTGGNKDMVRRKMAARFAWACEDPKELESWEIGLRLVESRTMVDVPASLAPRLTWGTRATMWVFRRCLPKVTQFYRLNLFAADAPGC